MANALTRFSRALVPAKAKASEGAYRPGPYLLSDGWLSATAGKYLNFWQMGFNVQDGGQCSATVRACVSCYAQTTAMCPGSHWRADGNDGRDRVTNSALARLLKRPNAYQSISDFLLNLTTSVYEDGNAYALALRNARFEVAELHLMHSRLCGARIAENGEIFYYLGGNEVVERMFGGEALAAVPARDVLHIRLNTRRNPLKGDPPLTAAMMDIAASNAMVAQALAYTSNEGRPSGVLETDLPLNSEQTNELRRRWNEITQGANAGGTPILTNGLKWRQVTPNSRDAQVAELLQIGDQRIASVYRVPVALLSLFSGQAPQTSTEPLMRFWLSSGFGFWLNHVEEAIGRFASLAGYPDEYLEFDTDALLRSSFKERLEALSAGTHRIYTINEARALEGLPAVEGGDEVRVQQQDVPLSAWDKTQPQTPRPDAPPASPPADAAENDNAEAVAAAAALWTRQILDAAERARRAAS